MTTIYANITEQVSEQAAAILSSMGLSIPEAVRKFLDWIVVEKRLPFEIDKKNDTPNVETVAAIKEAENILNARFQTADELFNNLEQDVINLEKSK